MIQRIQSLYLLIISVLTSVFLSGSYIKFVNRSSDSIILNFNGIWIAGEKAVPDPGLILIFITALALLITLIALTAIFLYRKRKIQMKLTMILIIAGLVLILLLSYSIFFILSNFQANFVFTFNLLSPLLCLIFSVLAHRAIRRAENIVRSYDRLR